VSDFPPTPYPITALAHISSTFGSKRENNWLRFALRAMSMTGCAYATSSSPRFPYSAPHHQQLGFPPDCTNIEKFCFDSYPSSSLSPKLRLWRSAEERFVQVLSPLPWAPLPKSLPPRKIPLADY
jgi:hypothetical protein